VIAALDTGSSFEGMGASREVLFSALAEPVLLLGLAAAVRVAHLFSLSDLLPETGFMSAELLLVTAALFAVFLCENARIPFDDPNTHLELTMIHEVMVLDHGGPDFAFITYASSLKLWVLGALITGLAIPVLDQPLYVNLGLSVAGLLLLSVIVGAVESVMARLRLLRVPQLLMAAGALAVIAFLFAMG
jgi:formate hydrogenlyase subunit 4